LVVLGFPSNDFSQESGSNREIADFCENTFGVKFPMFTKTSVSGPQAVPFFQQLAAQTDQKPRWNFYKYLVSREGRAVKAYTSMSGPDDKALVRDIERLLAQPAPKP
jgi:glutathione peroxidase